MSALPEAMAMYEQVTELRAEVSRLAAELAELQAIHSQTVSDGVAGFDALLFAAEAQQCNHDCNQGRNCTCGGEK